MSLHTVDIHDPELLPVERQALALMLDKREQYVDQGRAREAHGAGTMIMILWNTLKGGPHNDITNWGQLV